MDSVDKIGRNLRQGFKAGERASDLDGSDMLRGFDCAEEKAERKLRLPPFKGSKGFYK